MAFDDIVGYGCGVYKRVDNSMYMLEGGDAGVGFNSRYFVADKITVNILSNITDGEEDMRDVVVDFFEGA